MPFFNYKNIKITSVASAVPTTVINLNQFKGQYGEDYVEKFKEGTGVEEFRKTSKYQTASDLGFVAAEKIITEKQISRESIGAIVFVSHSPDYRRPSTSSVLHKRLGLSKECAALDVNLGCSAFVYGMQVSCSLMQCSDIERALLIVSESLTKMVYPTDKSVAMLFGDGGAAVLLEKTDEDFIFVKSSKKTFKINLSDILYIEALGDYVKIHTTDKMIVSYQSLKNIETLLPPKQFPRIHKSFIIALSRIDLIEGNQVKIRDRMLPVGTNFKNEFERLIRSI